MRPLGLPESIGVGKGTVTLDDFDQADTLILFGQNPATNHPRMLGELRAAAKRGATIVSVNPLRERGLERFASPRHVADMLSPTGVTISSVFIRPKLGGDLALLKGVAKRVLELDDAAVAGGAERVLDVEFIDKHTAHFAEFAADPRRETWDALIVESGVSREDIETLTGIYVRGKAVIATWGMGLTQHKHAVATVQMLTNLMLMRGHIGRPGAGLCPVRGHSNVQGDRTVGIDEKPTPEFLDRLGRVFGFNPPRRHGYDVVGTIQAMLKGQVKVFVGLHPRRHRAGFRCLSRFQPEGIQARRLPSRRRRARPYLGYTQWQGRIQGAWPAEGHADPAGQGEIWRPRADPDDHPFPYMDSSVLQAFFR